MLFMQFHFLFIHSKTHNFFGYILFSQISTSSTCTVYGAFLANIQRGKMQTENFNLVDQIFHQVQKQTVVLVNKSFPDL